ncbi:MAG: DUF2182 domain-containing protein [Rhodobacteraceae bacterium]|nr:DUF2182 domain-containing protein [Paracoccaceae bacterium]
MGGWHWLALFALILAAWVVLYLMSVPLDLREAGQVYGADFWRDLCTLTPDGAGYARMVLMWGLMSAAMMSPTALPAFATYEDLSRSAQNTNFGALVGGYLAVWLGFSVIAAAMQMVLFRADLLSAFGDSQSSLMSAALLLIAGIYQFSPLKEGCLSKCRRPIMFFMEHWDEGPWRNGVRLGLVCLGCCWALMLLAFVGGVMNIAFMGLATLIMVFEKLPDLGRYVTRPLGFALLIGAGGMALSAL